MTPTTETSARKELEGLCYRATPGPWIQSGVRQKLGTEDCIVVGPESPGWLIALPLGQPRDHAAAFSDAAFIAAANPTAIKALLADLAIAEECAADLWEIIGSSWVQHGEHFIGCVYCDGTTEFPDKEFPHDDDCILRSIPEAVKARLDYVYELVTRASTAEAGVGRLVANQRTPGTVEVCERYATGHDCSGDGSADGNNPMPSTRCGFYACPIRTPTRRMDVVGNRAWTDAEIAAGENLVGNEGSPPQRGTIAAALGVAGELVAAPEGALSQ